MSFGLGFWAAAGGVSNSFELISTISVTSGTTQFMDFTAIPSTYKHLQIRATARTNAADQSIYIIFNSDGTGSNYSTHQLRGDGSSVTSSGGGSTNLITGFTETTATGSSIFASNIIDISDYASTSKNKTVRSLSGSAGANQILLRSGAWYNTSAITSMRLNSGSGSFVVGTRFSLYGIRG